MKPKEINKPIGNHVKDIVIKNWQLEGTVLQSVYEYLDQHGSKAGKRSPRLFYPEDKDYYVKVRQTSTQIIAELIPL